MRLIFVQLCIFIKRNANPYYFRVCLVKAGSSSPLDRIKQIKVQLKFIMRVLQVVTLEFKLLLRCVNV